MIPAGSFTVGSPASEKGRYDDEGPWHRVTIPRAFALGKYDFAPVGLLRVRVNLRHCHGPLAHRHVPPVDVGLADALPAPSAWPAPHPPP